MTFKVIYNYVRTYNVNLHHYMKYNVTYYYVITYNVLYYYVITYNVIYCYVITYNVIYYYVITYNVIYYYVITYVTPRGLTQAVFSNRHSRPYNVSVISSYLTAGSYTMYRRAHSCCQAASSRNVEFGPLRFPRKNRHVIIGANGGVT